MYTYVVFLHVVGAAGLFAALGLEWAGLRSLRRSTHAGQAREWAGLLRSTPAVAVPAVLALLVTGVYLGTTRWGDAAWVILGLVGLVLLVIVGAAVTTRRANALAAALAGADDGPMGADLRRRAHDAALWRSASLKTTLAFGITFNMCVKPATAGACVAMGVALALGAVLGFPGTRARRAADRGVTQPTGS